MTAPSGAPQISVIVCTWNNARLLEQALASLAEQELPADIDYEVLVVDNNSTDDTAEVGRRFLSRTNSRFRYVLERSQGLSFARNRGVAEARGEIVAFTDEDAIVDPRWLAELWSVYQKEPEAVCVGGKVVLQFPDGSLPAWYDRRLDGFLSARDLPPGPARSERDFPHGVNMSFRKSVLQDIGGFHPLLASPRLGKIKMSGDETELCLRLLRKGKLIFFQPSAQVIHVIPERRLRPEYFLSLATGSGYLQIILDNDGQIGVSTWPQLNKYGRRLYRRWREYRSNQDTMTEAERFWWKTRLRTTWASVWYCLWAKHTLSRLHARVMAEHAAASQVTPH